MADYQAQRRIQLLALARAVCKGPGKTEFTCPFCRHKAEATKDAHSGYITAYCGHCRIKAEGR